MAFTVSSSFSSAFRPSLGMGAASQSVRTATVPRADQFTSQVRFSAGPEGRRSWQENLMQGRQLLGAGQYEQAFLALNTAYKQMPVTDAFNRCDALNYMALTCLKMKKLETGDLCAQAALQLAQRATKEIAPRQEWISLNLMGDLKRTQGKLDAARIYYNEVVKNVPNETALSKVKLPEADMKQLPLHVINARCGLSLIALAQSEPQKAVAQLEQALTLAMHANLNAIRPGQKQEAITALQESLITAHRENNQPEKALSYVEDILDSQRAKYGERSPKLALPLEVKADLLESLHEYDAARQVREEVADLEAPETPED